MVIINHYDHYYSVATDHCYHDNANHNKTAKLMFMIDKTSINLLTHSFTCYLSNTANHITTKYFRFIIIIVVTISYHYPHHYPSKGGHSQQHNHTANCSRYIWSNIYYKVL